MNCNLTLKKSYCFNNLYIPTVYSQCFTYEEQVYWLFLKLCELQEELNQVDIENIKSLISQAISELKNYVDEQDSQINDLINSQNQELKKYTDDKIEELYNTLIAYISKQVNFLLEYIENANTSLYNKIENELIEIRKLIDDIATNGIKVYNPTNGSKENLQKVINDLYGFLRYFGLTALEYDSLGLTAENYDEKNITARQYDLYARLLLGYTPFLYMISPFTGKYTLITDVINQLANFHKENPITAQEYDDLGLTAQNYDEKLITAYNYDFTAKSILMP